MENDEDSGGLILDAADGEDFFQDKSSLPTAISHSEIEIPGGIARNTHTALPSNKLNEEISPTLESKKEKAESISKLESSYYELQAKWEISEAQHVRDQAEIDRMNSQLESQMAFSLNIGAVMGDLVWRASCEPKVINQWFKQQSYQNKVEEFVSIADRIIGIFLQEYQEVLPPYSTDEYQFAMGLLGTIANMSSIPEGREFLFENKSGKSLIRNLVLFMPRLPMPSGYRIKRLIMVILWNISVNNNALCYLFELKIGQVVAHCLDESNPEIFRISGFKLLQSITYNLTDPRRLDDIFKYVPIENIRRIADDTEQDKVGTVAKKFLDYLTDNANMGLWPNNDRRRNE